MSADAQRDGAPKALLPFIYHGFNFDPQLYSSGNFYGDCRLCGGEGKFYIEEKEGRWDCKKCGRSGNVYTFLRLLWDALGPLPRERLKALAKNRQLPLRFLRSADVRWDDYMDRYVLALYNAKGALVNLKTYRLPVGKKRNALMATKGLPLPNGMYGARRLAGRPQEPIYLAEGEWDAIAWNGLRRLLKKKGTVVSVGAGAGTKLVDSFVERFRGREVYVLYDNDKAGREGELKIAAALKDKAQLRFAHWDEAREPDGWDVRDWVVTGVTKEKKPLTCWTRLHMLLKETPRLGEVAPGEVEEKPDLYASNHELPAPRTRDEALAVWDKWLVVSNYDVLDICMAVAISVRYENIRPLWLLVTGPPSSGKSTAIMALEALPWMFSSSTLTPSALISGVDRHTGGDASMLPHLNNKCISFKDLTALFSMAPEKLAEILGLLRDSWDGHVRKDFGNGVVRDYRVRFAWIAGVTSQIFSSLETMNSVGMGERFLMIDVRRSEPLHAEDAVAYEAVSNSDRITVQERELREAISGYLGNLELPKELPAIPEALKYRLVGIAKGLAMARASVPRSRFGSRRHLTGMVEPEAPARIAGQLAVLTRLLAVVRGVPEVTDEEVRIASLTALDSVTPMRFHVLTYILRKPGISFEELALRCRLNGPTVKFLVEDLRMLGLVRLRRLRQRQAAQAWPTEAGSNWQAANPELAEALRKQLEEVETEVTAEGETLGTGQRK